MQEHDNEQGQMPMVDEPIIFDLPGGWRVRLVGVDGTSVEDVILDRADGKYFRVQMVQDTYPHPMFFENDNGADKIDDVVIELRRAPSGRYCVRVDSEKHFLSQIDFEDVLRAKRSSLDNVKQAVLGPVTHTGWVNANSRRIGGKPIETHVVIAEWDPALEDELLDVYEYVQTKDALGKSAFLAALQSITDFEVAKTVFLQIRNLM